MQQKTDTEKEKGIFIPRWLKLLAIGLGVFLVVIIGTYLITFRSYSIGEPANFGQFGDYIGGLLNPILTFFTIFLLVWSINKQLEELELTRNELELTRIELKHSAEAMDSAQQAHHKSYELQLNEVKRTQLQQALNEQYQEFESKWTRRFLIINSKIDTLSLEDVFDLKVHQTAEKVKTLKNTVTDRMSGEPKYQYQVETIILKDLKEILRRICQFTQEIYENIESAPIASALHRKASQLNDKMLDINVLTDKTYNINKAMIRLPDHLNDLI